MSGNVHLTLLLWVREGYAFDSSRVGRRGFYYEAWRNLAEDVGEGSVSVFNVEPGELSSA